MRCLWTRRAATLSMSVVICGSGSAGRQRRQHQWQRGMAKAPAFCVCIHQTHLLPSCSHQTIISRLCLMAASSCVFLTGDWKTAHVYLIMSSASYHSQHTITKRKRKGFCVDSACNSGRKGMAAEGREDVMSSLKAGQHHVNMSCMLCMAWQRKYLWAVS